MSDPPAIPLGPFDLLRPIGRGGMADVWQGEHREQKVPVAVKVITAAQAREARFREAFQREVQAVARLMHPGVVMVFDHGTVPDECAEISKHRVAPGAPYLAMELASWGSLDQVDLPLRWDDLYPILLALLDALAHAHARGVIHRDLKPGNVLMAAPWDVRPGVKLTDFGIAHALEGGAGPDEYAASGTPMYMAPEQFMGKWRDYGPWTDLYAVGCLTHVLATGKPPFKGKNLAQLAYDHMSRPPPVIGEDVSVPAQLQPWIWRLMQKNPADRFQRAADAAWALVEISKTRRAKLVRADPNAPGATAAFTSSAEAPAVSEERPAKLAALTQDGLPHTSDQAGPAELDLEIPGARRIAAADSDGGSAPFEIPPPSSPMDEGETEASKADGPRSAFGPWSGPRPAPRLVAVTEVELTQQTVSGLGAAVPTHFASPRPVELHTVVHHTQVGEALPWAAQTPGSGGAEPAATDDRELAPRRLPPLPESWARDEEAGPSIRLVGAGLSLYGLRTLPLVDRRPERDTLWSALQSVRQTGRVEVLVLRGHAGHGKSRLVEWIAERADEVGSAQILRASHSPTGGPSDGVPRMVARFLRSVELTGDDLRERTERQLRAQGVADSYEWLALTELMEPTPNGAARVRFSNATEKHVLVQRLLERAARERPVVVWLEDLQWGADALALARHLLLEQSRSEHPILVLATVREEALAERPVERRLLDKLLQTAGAKSHRVAALAEEDHRQLVEGLLMLDESLAGQIADRTGGNPLFAIQLVGDWVERGVLEVGAHGFVLQAGEEAVLPDDIHQVWQQRVERVLAPLPATALHTLEIAATLGHSAETAEWQGACREAGLSIPPLLVIALMENRLAVPAEGGWAFAHGMLRESLTRSSREAGRARRHHAACARMLVKRYGRTAPSVSERLGAHYRAAGEGELALDPLRRGAVERLESSEFRQALALVEAREQALDELGSPAEDPRRAEGWVLRSRIHAMRGRFEEAATWAERATEAARRLGWRRVLPDALTAAASIAHERGDQGAALNAFDEARRLYVALGDRGGVARCLVGRGEAVYRLGDLPRAERFLSEGLTLLEAEQDRAGMARALLRLGVVALWRNDPVRARQVLEQQLDILKGLGNRFQMARCIAALGELARQIGDLDEAERAYRRALEIDVAIGSKNTWMERLNLGLVLLARGEFAAAGELSERVARDLGDSAEPSQRCAVWIQRLPSMADAAAWAQWDEALPAAKALLEETGLTDGDVAWLLQLAAERALDRGEPGRAKAAGKLAIRQWRALGRMAEAEAVEERLRSGV